MMMNKEKAGVGETPVPSVLMGSLLAQPGKSNCREHSNAVYLNRLLRTQPLDCVWGLWKQISRCYGDQRKAGFCSDLP